MAVSEKLRADFVTFALNPQQRRIVMTGSITRLGAAALLTILLLSATPSSAVLKPCQGAWVSGAGSGPDMHSAMKHAVFNWRMNAQDAYGAYFDNYRLAEDKARHCNETGGLFYCRISAHPCKSEKPSTPSTQHY